MFYEAKKLYWKQSGLLLLILFWLAEVAATVLNGYDSYFTINTYEDTYLSYMEEYGGRLTEDTKIKIEEESDLIRNAPKSLLELKREWNQGSLSKEEYEARYQKYLDYQSKEDIFTLVYAKYNYVKERPEERCILDTRGWETLLCHDAGSFILILGLVVMTTLIFCGEYESNMEWILLTNKNGKYRTGWQKIGLAAGNAVILSLLFQITRVIYLLCAVGLDGGSYPIKSIEFFENTQYDVTLWEALFVCNLLQLWGAVFLTILTAFLALCIHKKAAAFVFSSAAAVLPLVFFAEGSNLYRMPFPYGFLKSTGYLWGDQYAYKYNDEGRNVKYCTFEAVSKGALFTVLILGGIICIAVTVLCILRYSHTSPRRVGTFFLKKNRKCTINAVICVLVLGAVCGGCGRSTNLPEKTYVYNSNDRFEKIPYFDGAIYLDSEKNRIMQETSDGEAVWINRSLNGTEEVIVSICVSKDECYYMTNNPDNICKIYRLSLKSYREELLYTSGTENSEDFYGVLGNEKIDSDWYAEKTLEYRYCFADKDEVYLVLGHSLVQIENIGGEQKVIINNLGSMCEICYVNGMIFYVDTQGKIKCSKGDYGRAEDTDIYGEEIRINGDVLEYIDLYGEQKFYLWKKKGSAKK